MANVTRTFPVEGFDAIQLRWYGDMVVEQGDQESLEVEGDEEVLEKLNVHVDGTVLILELSKDWLERLIDSVRLLGRGKLTYRVKVKRLRSVAISGNGSFRTAALRGDALDLRVSGNGNVDVSDLRVNELEVRVSGRAKVAMSGAAGEQSLSVSGSADLALQHLEGKRAVIRISGRGEVDVNVREELDIAMSGMGTVRYRGDPKVQQRMSGIGSVTRVEA